MNASGNEAEHARDVLAIGGWQGMGGATRRDCLDGQFGRRIEADRSWTVYHVFSGVPVDADGQTMTGLSRRDATHGMLSLHNRNDERHGNGTAARQSTGWFRTGEYLS